MPGRQDSRRVATFVSAMVTASILFGITPSQAVDHPDLFVVTSPDFTDNGMLKAANAGTGKSPRGPWDCGGNDVSPALAWSYAPRDTKSFALVMEDPDASSGLGFAHWILYDIPATVTSVARGEGNKPAAKFVLGVTARNRAGYAGPCAEPGGKPHHFIFKVYALDIVPGTLAKGLGRDALLEAIHGHNLAEASIVARYQRPAQKAKQG
jgi:Raf kinase inhibitor-like YbhB/YbcL family protein